MTLALWCVLFAGILPILTAGLAKGGAKDFDNANPREWLGKLEGWRRRANAAQNNGFEAFPLFAAAIIVATMKLGPNATVDGLAVAWVLLRIGYVWAYVADKPTLRSSFFALALFSAIAIFVAPLWA